MCVGDKPARLYPSLIISALRIALRVARVLRVVTRRQLKSKSSQLKLKAGNNSQHKIIKKREINNFLKHFNYIQYWE